MPEVVYAPARPFSRNRFILQLVTVVAVVLAATFVISIFFKVKTVTVSGAEKYTAWDVYEASGIQEGDGLLTFSRARACGKITTALPYVKSVQIGIKLPDTVNIEIVESDVVYAVQAENSSWWLMTAEGKIVEQSDATAAENTTVIQGIKLLAPTLGEEAVVAQTGSLQDSSAGTIPVTVTAQERLNVLLEILQNLEMNGVIGEMASVDVSNLNDLQMWYGDRYQVKLGDRYKLDFKIERMALAISQMDDYQRGMLDVSYTTWSDKVGYTPFE